MQNRTPDEKLTRDWNTLPNNYYAKQIHYVMTSVQHVCGWRLSQAWKTCGAFPIMGCDTQLCTLSNYNFFLVFIFQLHERAFVYKFFSPNSNPNFAIVFIRINLKQNDTLSLSLLEFISSKISFCNTAIKYTQLARPLLWPTDQYLYRWKLYML